MRARLGTNMLANAASAVVPLAVAAVSTPLIIDRLGTAAFGIWTLLASFAVYLGIAESGFGPAVQRFVAVSHGAGETHVAARLLWTVLIAYGVVGVGVCALVTALASDIVHVFDFPLALEDDAEDLLRVVAFALPVSLLSAGLANVLFGLERFKVSSAWAAAGAVALLVALIAILGSGRGLRELGWALLASQAVPLLGRAWALRDLALGHRPGVADRMQLRAIGSFSARLQVSALSVLINGQSDRVVAGLVAPAATVGQLGVGAQVAESGRLVAGALLQPIVSRLSALHGAGDTEAAAAEYRRLSRVWITATVGATAVGVAALGPLLQSWLGDGFGLATGLGAVLMLAYGINVVTGVAASYARSLGVIGIEARAGVYMVALNIVLTVPLALAIGVEGVVLGTLGANVFGTAWFFHRIQAVAPLQIAEPLVLAAKVLALATLAAGAAFGLGTLAAETLPRFVAILPVAAVTAAALGAFLKISLGVPLRSLLPARA